MTNDGSKRSQPSASAPPRSLNVLNFVESRVPELESLHSVISNRLGNDFRSKRNKRRRTTAYDNQAARKRGRKAREIGEANGLALNDNGENKEVSRRVRRRIELRMNPQAGFCTSGDGTKRLRTHVWHAKRFTMTKLWGFHIPLGLHGRGRGSRALLKQFRYGALLHDASYHVAVQLEGPEESILSILKVVLTPFASADAEERPNSVLDGTIYGRAMLHHIGASDCGSVAPVNYLWRPLHQQSRGSNAFKETQNTECNRQLWIWMHPSAFSEGYDVLSHACQKEMSERGVLVTCSSLEGQLAKLELMGPKAFQLLQNVLHTSTCNSDSTWNLRKHSDGQCCGDSILKSSSVLENEENINNGSVLTLTVMDPRTLSKKNHADIPQPISTSMPNDTPAWDVRDYDSLEEGNPKCIPSSNLEPEERSSPLYNRNIWDVNSGITPPAEERVLSKERHHEHMNFIFLDDSKIDLQNTSANAQCSSHCPILLFKDIYQKVSVVRWSIILPISWVRAFWVSLITKGAHAIGCREKHWIACELGLPDFPADFPDCSAYYCLKETEAAASNQKAELRPSLTRPPKVPVPPPWNSIWVTLDKGLNNVQIPMDKDTVTSNSDSLESDKKLFSHLVNGVDAVVARTSSMLSIFLDKINGDHLLLFPKVPDKKRNLNMSAKEKSDIGHSQNGIQPISYQRPLCLLRVHLRAYKEGVFEEGAVVCAPHHSDLSLWVSRSGCEKGKLQMPHSSVGSYFKEKLPGRWELQIPEEPNSLKTHHWPIGFVTTGSVRGSKKPLAEAFCEAVCLARLREEQWNGKPAKQRKKEVYVLVRNLRSSAYRLALASVVLEQQEQDLEFM